MKISNLDLLNIQLLEFNMAALIFSFSQISWMTYLKYRLKTHDQLPVNSKAVPLVEESF